MKAWFNALTARERLVVAAGGLIGGSLLVYVALIEPVAQRFQAQRAQVQALEEDLAWMRQAARTLDELGITNPGDASGDDGKAPYVTVDEALRGAALPQPATLEPEGSGGVRLEFEEVPFDPLMSVLAGLRQQNGLHVTRARLTSTAPGMVRAQLTLQRPDR